MVKVETGLYHGTRAPFGQGGLVLPGNELGKDNHGLGRSDVVYVTPDLSLAFAFSLACRGKGKPRVFEVMPHTAPVKDDSTIGEDEHESYSCDSATILRDVTAAAREQYEAGHWEVCRAGASKSISVPDRLQSFRSSGIVSIDPFERGELHG